MTKAIRKLPVLSLFVFFFTFCLSLFIARKKFRACSLLTAGIPVWDNFKS